MADKRNQYKVRYIKPVKGMAYFPGDEGVLHATEAEYHSLINEGFVEALEVKPTKAKKSGGASSRKS